MIVFPENRSGERGAVFHAATNPHRIELETAQAGSGLARVGDLRGCSPYGVDRPARERCDPREPLQKVERDPLTGEQGAGRAADDRERRAGVRPGSVRNHQPHGSTGVELPKDRREDRQTGGDQRSLGDEARLDTLFGGASEQMRGDVLARAILG